MLWGYMRNDEKLHQYKQEHRNSEKSFIIFFFFNQGFM